MASSCEVKALHPEYLVNLDDCTGQYSSSILKDKHLWFYSIIVVIIAIIAAIIISKGVNSQAYTSLIRPSWEPTALLFIVVWIIFYIFIAYIWFLADKLSEYSRFSRSSVNILFALNVFLGLAWIYLYFGAVDVSASLFTIILLLILTGVMLWYLFKLNHTSACLFSLYFLWILILTILNFNLYHNNRPTTT